MSDNLEAYRRGEVTALGANLAWTLDGAGMEHLGQGRGPVDVGWPEYGADELLIRHDACVLCSADVKLVKLGEMHPRISRDIRTEPVVPGHEVSLTVAGVGENLTGKYHIGDRFIVQPDVYKYGVGYGYGFMIPGGLCQYSVLDHRVLEGDAGSYLLPLQPGTGYAEGAMAEPWAAVVAAYGLEFRTELKQDGICWILGSKAVSAGADYTISRGMDASSHPDSLMVSQVPETFLGWLRARASALGIKVIAVEDIWNPPLTAVDDIILLGSDPDLIEATSPFLAARGILAVITDRPLRQKVKVDIGRVHYDRILYVGGAGPDVAQVYAAYPVRAELQRGGRAWFVGAGGPIGSMHVQRAIQLAGGPKTIFCTALHAERLRTVESTYRKYAAEKGVEFVCVSREEGGTYTRTLEIVGKDGFDYVMVLAPDEAATEEAAQYLRPEGVLNVFTGVPRGTVAELDLNDTIQKGVRIIGFSGSTVEDMRLTLRWIETGKLVPNRLVMAIGGLDAARDGMEAVAASRFPGKVVIYPSIVQFPLTCVTDLRQTLPGVHARLKDAREWTTEAEDEFIRTML